MPLHSNLAVAALLEARLCRRIGEVVMANIQDIAISPNTGLRNRKIDLAAECDPDKLTLTDFKWEDFAAARSLIASWGYKGSDNER